MAETEDEIACLPPAYAYRLAIPQGRKLRLTYGVYKPSLETIKLRSEADRTVFAEALMENPNLGPLSDLCVGAMGIAYGPKNPLSLGVNDPLKIRLYYDSLSTELPLKDCFHLTDEQYWRRVVLKKTNDKELAFKKDYNWKNHAISLKYVELVEACSAEYWPEEEMKNLADKVKEFVTEMHISKLKSLSDSSFQQYFENVDGDSLGSTNSTNISSVSSTEVSSMMGIEEGEEEGEGDGEGEGVKDGGGVDEEREVEKEEIPEKTEEDLEVERVEAEIKAAKRAEQHAAHEEKRAAIERQLERRHLREEKMRLSMETPPPVPKKKKKVKVKSVFDIEISEDEDEDAEICDQRNLKEHLKRRKSYKYPPEHCHHIDLRFVRFFENLVSFSIEFQGPPMQRDFHTRHFNFSYDDIARLAIGVSYLSQLRIFKLRNSRMDARKLNIIVKPLAALTALEEVDFSYDQLYDDCSAALFDLFHHSSSIKSLQLMGNFLGESSMLRMGVALSRYAGTLEFLGLSGNPLGDAALHALVSRIVDTQQVKHLCLTGITVSQVGIACCIANELLRRHTVLEKMELVAISIGHTAGNELLKALDTNTKILELDVRGCDLDYDMEFDVEIILKRNRFLAANPFIGDTTKTEEEFNEWLGRIKNEILLKVTDAVQKRAENLRMRPDDYCQESKHSIIVEKEISEAESIYSLDKHLEIEEKHSVELSKDGSGSDKSDAFNKQPFVYEANEFNEAQIIEHMFAPGPGERYYYFKNYTQKKEDDV